MLKRSSLARKSDESLVRLALGAALLGMPQSGSTQPNFANANFQSGTGRAIGATTATVTVNDSTKLVLICSCVCTPTSTGRFRVRVHGAGSATIATTTIVLSLQHFVGPVANVLANFNTTTTNIDFATGALAIGISAAPISLAFDYITGTAVYGGNWPFAVGTPVAFYLAGTVGANANNVVILANSVMIDVQEIT